MLKQIATSRDMTLKKFFGYGPRRNWEDIARRPGRRHGFTLGWSHWAVTPNVVRDVSGRAQRPLGVPLSRIELH
jgi:predicted metal-dependent peptidase